MKIDSSINDAIEHLKRLDSLGHVRFQMMCEWNANNFEISLNKPTCTDGTFRGVEVRKFYEAYIEKEIKEEIEILASYGITIED